MTSGEKIQPLVVADVDGTLLHSDAPVSRANIAAVQCLVRHQVPLVLATGRAHAALDGIINQLGAPSAVIGSNGNFVRVGSAPGAILSRFPVEVVTQMFHVAEKYRADAVCYMTDGLNYTPSASAALRAVLSRYSEPTLVVLPVVDILRRIHDIVHIHLIQSDGWSRRISIPHTTTARSVHEYVTVTPSGIDKASGLEHLLNMSHFAHRPIFVVADGENDLPLFAVAGAFSIALRSGSPALCAQAQLVAPGVEEDGFAWAVNSVIIPNIEVR